MKEWVWDFKRWDKGVLKGVLHGIPAKYELYSWTMHGVKKKSIHMDTCTEGVEYGTTGGWFWSNPDRGLLETFNKLLL